MDSFYSAPRQPPVPTTINRFERAPVVPEVSVVENSFFSQPKLFPPLNLNPPLRPQNNHFGYENSLIHHKKQVRFESPSTMCPHFNQTVNGDKENIPQPSKTIPDLNGKTFKQIYMANVPDRHLDLSIFEPAQEKKVPEIESPVKKFVSPEKRYDSPAKRYYSSVKKYDSPVTTNTLRSIENRTNFYQEAPQQSPPSTKIVERCTEIAKPNDEPTIKDLYKIIQQQNEQIMMLQRQVNNLKQSIKQPEAPQLQFEGAQDHPYSPSKKGMFSFDVKATSFEVSFRPQHAKFRKQNEFLEPRIREIVECDDSKENEDVSLRLEESLNLKDSYLSTVPSIQINMDEYQSSEEEEESVNPGITFYKDLMDQVNNVLKKMQAQSECQMVGGKNNKNNVTGQTMKAVKQATLQHLKSIGVNLSPIQETNEISSESSLDKNYDSSEISFAVKQLLMKYLPDDKLTQALNKPKNGNKPVEKKCKPENGEFSFATLQYLKKYNIIDNGRKFPEFEKKTTKTAINDAPKILDVTALKLQPKLL